MRLRTVFGLAVWTVALAPAQDPEPPKTEATSRLPSWVHLGLELRGRGEFGSGFEGGQAEDVYLNRLRLNLTLEPDRRIRFVFEGQDARAFCLHDRENCEALRNPLDVRLGYLEVGYPEQGWQMRVGRQELAVGDERLIGADTYWDVFGQSFDALRLAFVRGKLRAEVFGGYRVRPALRRPDGYDDDSRVAGASLQWKAFTPYLIWKRGNSAEGHRDVIAPGIRASGELPAALDYNVEMALETGHVAAQHLSAWAGHWEIGWRPIGPDQGPRLALEFNYASGDSNPRDARYGTFDDMYPAGFNRFGMADPIAWRNIRYPVAGAEFPLAKRWTAYAGFRSYWLSSIQDGLYPGGDEYLMRNPAATSAHVGEQALVSAAYTPSARWRFSAGYGRLFAGGYLRQCGYPAGIRTFYILSGLTL